MTLSRCKSFTGLVVLLSAFATDIRASAQVNAPELENRLNRFETDKIQPLRTSINNSTREMLDDIQNRFNGLLSIGDFSNALGLTKRILGDGGVSDYLRRRLLPATRDLLAQCVKKGEITRDCGVALANDLNTVIRGEPLSDQGPFKNVTLRDATKRLLQEPPANEKTVRLNRMLLEDAYPNEIAKNPLNTIDEDQEQLGRAIAESGRAIEEKIQVSTFNVDRFWVLLAAVLVFFMQAGFKALEVGIVREKFDTIQAAQKLFSWITTYVGYFPLGFGIMFGVTHSGWFGSLGSPGDAIVAANRVIIDTNNAIQGTIRLSAALTTVRGWEFFLFQAAFAATAVTIPSGATAERMKLIGYILLGLFIAAWVYPVFGHWAWGGSTYSYYYSPDKQAQMTAYLERTSGLQGWLQKQGFHDFAGSTVVHSVGGWFALVGTWFFLGPRPGRFRDDGTANLSDFPSRSRGYAILGVFMLWFGWWGFNGGSSLRYDTSIAKIILNTNLAGAAAGLSAYAFGYFEEWFLHKPGSRWFQKGLIPEKTIGGVLGGLVAITASCDLASSAQAFFLVGISAGIVHNLVFDLLLRFKIDDPVGAFPVHTGCGVLGTILVAFMPVFSLKQFVVQAKGVWFAGIWTCVMAALFFWFLRSIRALESPEADWMTGDQLNDGSRPRSGVAVTVGVGA